MPQDLSELHRQGRVAAEYPRVRTLLAETDDAGLRRAGQLLARTAPDDVLREHPDTPVVSVAVTGNSVVSGLVAPLTAELARHGMLLRPHVADFNSYVFDLSDPESGLYSAGADLVVCALDAGVVFDEVPVQWRPDDVARVFAGKVDLLAELASAFASVGRGTLVVNTLPLPRDRMAELVGHRDRALLGAVWREANARLLRLVTDQPSLVVLDLEPLLGTGLPLRDARLGTYAKTQLSPEVTGRYARELAHLIRGLSGRAKKALVLDLDNTTWGGVLGDDGIEGIEVAGSYRGEAFRALQRTAKQLAGQGVLLAAVSKNDIESVMQVLREHPDMTLREDDFVRIVANWAPKHENLHALAGDLNLGIDSFVFADDSAYECGLVRRELPEVTVLHLDDDPALHVERLLADDWFAVPDVTTDDLKRPERYREELVRKDFLDSFSSLDHYLRELDVTVELATARPADLARVSQITLRTNQFNLTTRRLQQTDVQALADSPDVQVLTIRSSDRFGNNGVVGAVFLAAEGPVWRIDNFVLSCRVFSRGIEQACLSAVLEHARVHGAREVVGSYRASGKNGKVRDFYARNGFVAQPRAAGATADDGLVFRHDLAEIAGPPIHVRLTRSIEGPKGTDRDDH
ncbi:HAD-IIIC family phosphatase [Streptomyces sp. NPDC052052]|uniref:HAD-IIIC family phosphatase n=1 Tax=Streptomyces sp. NPDC052052 TaxID=3154756 RepID=UPI003425FB38